MRIPELDLARLTQSRGPRDEDAAIGRNRQATDLPRMCLELDEFPSRGKVPEEDRAITIARDQLQLIRSENHRSQIVVRKDRDIAVARLAKIVPLETAEVAARRLRPESLEDLLREFDLSRFEGLMSKPHL